MGITKREAPISWRPSKKARVRLARLISETGLSRNELLNRLVIEQGGLLRHEVSRYLEPGLAKVTRQRLDAEFQTSVSPKVAPKDARTQQEKMDDFYRANMAKGKK